MPGRSLVTAKVPKDLSVALHDSAERQGISLNQLIATVLQSYVVSGNPISLPTIQATQGVNPRQLAMQSLDSAAPALVQMLLDKAKAGDREAAIYCLDRLMGKPRQQVDQTVLHVPMDARYFQNEVKRLLGTDATPVVPPLLSEGNALSPQTDTPASPESGTDSGT